MSLEGGAQPGLPQSVWDGVNKGAQASSGPPPQHAPYPPFMSQHAAWGAALRERLEAKTRAEGHDPRVLLRKFVDLAATAGITKAAVAFLRYIGMPVRFVALGAAIAFLAAMVIVRPRQDGDWDADWMLSTGSPTRDAIRVVGAGGAVLAAGGWLLVKVSGGASLFRRSA